MTIHCPTCYFDMQTDSVSTRTCDNVLSCTGFLFQTLGTQ